MKRSVWMIAAAFACATTAVMAQSPTTSSTSTTDNKDKVTVTGCLEENSKGSATATTAGQFVLASASMGRESASSTAGSTTGTTGTTGSRSATSTAGEHMSYVLDGHDSELKSHVGHEIEITGSLEPASSAGATATSTTAGASHMTPGASHLRVATVRMIAASCSAK